MSSAVATPVRLQLSRAKGFSLDAHSRAVNGLPAVNVARPGKWGNPYAVGAADPFMPLGNWMSRERAVELYRRGVEQGFLTVPYTVLTPEERGDGYRSFGAHAVLKVVHQLRGHNLACWCPLDGRPCHADVLLALANPGLCEEVR